MIHAGGVVVAGKALYENIPIMLGKTDTAVLPLVQLAMEDLDFFKALKIDVLGLQTCTIIHDTMKLAGLDWDWYDNEDFFDEKIYEMLRRGETTDVFQMAKHTPRQMIKDFKCNSLEGLTAINAGNRPGPLAKIDELGGKSMVELFKERTENQFLIPKVHPAIDKILEPTNGCLWYQEQCQQLGMVMAGYSLGMADLRIRKTLAKKKIKEIPALKNEFVYGKLSLYDEDHNVIGISEEDSPLCVGAVRNGFSEEVALEIFSIMEKFAKYAFNKSHSAAYAAIAYKTAYLSYYYPAEYAVACMSEYDDKEKILSTLAMCRKRGIKILPPDINKSDMGFTVEVQPDGTKAIRYGLAGIHKVGDKAVRFLMEVRKAVGTITSFDDYYMKFHDPIVTVPILDDLKEDKSKKSQNPLKKDVEQALILAGAFDEFEPNRYKVMNHYLGTIRKEKKYEILAENDYKRRNKLALEKEYMGTYISEHPLEPFPYTDLDSAGNKEFVEVTGTVLDIRNAKARNGQYAKVRIEIKDGTETSVMLFGKMFEKYRPSIKKGHYYVFAGEWNEQFRNINATRVRNIVVKEMQPTSDLPDTFDDESGVVDTVVQQLVSGAPVRNDIPLVSDDPFDIFAV